MNIPPYDPIEAFREIAQSGSVTTAKVTPVNGAYQRFSYQVDALTLVQNWDGLVSRAESAESRVRELESVIAALVAGLGKAE